MKVEESDEFFISVDPGINYCSVVVVKINDKFKVLETHLVNNNRAFKAPEKELELIHGTRTVKIMNIIEKIREMIDKYGINRLIIEAPFYSSLTPMAYGSLLEVIFGIKYLLVMPEGLTMSLIEPTAVKRLFANKGNASKGMMKEFLISRVASKEILLDTPIEELSEHEIDGIAVGFTHWLNKKIQAEQALQTQLKG